MTELSNAVTVLIARMESHPEDFNTVGFGRVKFRNEADALYGLAGLDKERAGSYWFLTDADKEALIEAWKKYHRTAMEKEVMEKIFDDGAEEREAEARKQVQALQRAQINKQMATIGAQAAQNSYGHNAMNAAQIDSGITSAHTGLFGGVFK